MSNANSLALIYRIRELEKNVKKRKEEIEKALIK